MKAHSLTVLPLVLMFLLLTIVVYATSQFDGPIIYHEEFSDNHNNWDLFKDKYTDSAMANGVYRLTNKIENLFSLAFNTVPIDQNGDFKIETCLAKVQGVGNNLFGLVWGHKNMDSFYVFGISAAGSYTYLKLVDKKWEYAIDWTPSSYIRKGNAGNRLAVVKTGAQLQFFINGHQVDEAPFEKFFGNNIGIYASSKLTVEFDNLLVTKYPGDAFEGRVVFQEDFTNNDNRWFEIEDDVVGAKVERGNYYYEHKAKKSGYFTWCEVDLREEQDFKIETTITKVSGVDDYAYSLTWGLKDTKNYYAFGINGNGNYLVEKSVDGKWENIFDWATSSYINRKNATNKLAIIKNKDKLEFYINERKVNELPYTGFFGNKIGFLISDKIKLAIDSITVTQYDGNTI